MALYFPLRPIIPLVGCWATAYFLSSTASCGLLFPPLPIPSRSCVASTFIHRLLVSV